MPQTILAEAHLFLSKDRSRISLEYLRGLLELGADPYHDPELEGLEGRVSLIYAGRISATLVVPGKVLRPAARGAANGMVRLLLACPKPQILLRHEEAPHFFLTKHARRWQVRLVNRPRYQFKLGEKEFFVVTRFATRTKKIPIWLGILGRTKNRTDRFENRPAIVLPALET